MIRYRLVCFLAMLGALLLACRPVIAIGWGELIVLAGVMVLLLGPLLWRLYRFLERLQRFEDAKDTG